jgi:hypothetical protein
MRPTGAGNRPAIVIRPLMASTCATAVMPRSQRHGTSQ